MAKILTIKLHDDDTVDIRSHLPEGMTEAEVNDILTTALPMAVAALAMFEVADEMPTGMMEEEEECDECPCCCRADDQPDDHP